MSLPNHLDVTGRSMKVLRTYVANQFQIPLKELPRILFHAVLLALIIAGFWLLDSLKDPVLARIVGIEYQPVAKAISVLTTLLVTCLYDWLTSHLARTDLFHIISGAFGVAFMVISALLADPQIGLDNKEAIGGDRMLGWFAYLTIESYGSLMVALFWSFTNSTMKLEEAKGAYGLIISLAQLGAIAGSTLATQSRDIGMPVLFLIGAMSIFSVSLLVKVYVILFSSQLRRRSGSYDIKEDFIPSSGSINLLGGFSEGFYLIVRNRYILLVFGVSCLYEVVITTMDYQFKLLAATNSSAGGKAGSNEDDFASLLGHFGQVTNLCSFIVSFFGFSFLVHRFGVRNSLMITPAVLFVLVVVTNLSPSLPMLFIAVSVIKALLFSLHDPVKELLYIPTSLAIKFKAKAWIDVFGSRLAKATGSLLSYLSGGDPVLLRTIAELPSLIISLVVLLLAFLVGTEFQRMEDEKSDERNGQELLEQEQREEHQQHEREDAEAGDGLVDRASARRVGVDSPDSGGMRVYM